MFNPHEMVEFSPIFKKLVKDAVVLVALELRQSLERLNELLPLFRRNL